MEIEQFFFHRLRPPCRNLFAADTLAAVVTGAVYVRAFSLALGTILLMYVSHKAEQKGCTQPIGAAEFDSGFDALTAPARV